MFKPISLFGLLSMPLLSACANNTPVNVNQKSSYQIAPAIQMVATTSATDQLVTKSFQCTSNSASMRQCNAAMTKKILSKYSGDPGLNQCQLYDKKIPGYLKYEFYNKVSRRVIICKDVRDNHQCILSSCEIVGVDK